MRRWFEDDTMAPDSPADLVLWVAPQAPASLRARRNLEALLEDYDRRRIRLVVRDVAKEAALAESDHVVFIPTLIVRTGEAVARVVGDLADGSAVTNMLAMGGLEKEQ